MKMTPFTRREWTMVAALAFLVCFALGQIAATWLPARSDLAGWSGLAAAIAAFLAIGLGYIGFIETERNNKREHRPYLRVEIVRAIFVGPSLSVHFEVENYGRTFATDVRISITAFIIPSHLEGDRMVHLGGGPGTMEVHTELNMDFAHPGKPHTYPLKTDGGFEPFEQSNAENDAATLVVEFEATYSDVFIDRHGERGKVYFRGTHGNRTLVQVTARS